MLPSEALSKATTFDLYVLDVSTRWLAHRQDIADGKQPNSSLPSQAEMLDMIKRTKEISFESLEDNDI